MSLRALIDAVANEETGALERLAREQDLVARNNLAFTAAAIAASRGEAARAMRNLYGALRDASDEALAAKRLISEL